MEPKHFLHEHPLHFFEEWSNNVHGETKAVNCSSGCGHPISAQFYACIDCKFFLHKSCFELPLNITHPFHDNHPLILLSESPYKKGVARCDLCGVRVNGFVYHCSFCEFDLHIKCASLPQFLITGDIRKVDHQMHVEHPLFFIENLSHEVKLASFRSCNVCLKQLSDTSFYTCFVCKFFLHKSCSEIPLNITHPFHDKHSLILLSESPYKEGVAGCDFCDNIINGFVYHCSSCQFDLDIRCALLPEFLNGDFPKVDHRIHVEHPLFFIKNLSHEIELDFRHCSVCLEQFSDTSFYTCLVCKLFLHKSCSELPLSITHPFHDHKHPLTLLDKKSSTVSCDFCGLFKRFVYHCSSCKFNLDTQCALLPEFLNGDLPKVAHHLHEHSLFFIENLSHKVKLASCRYCRVCLEESTDASFYTCLVCKLFIHKSCSKTELPLKINHPFHQNHKLTLTLKSNVVCQLCHNNRDPVGLFYHCSSCRFNLDIKCAFLPQFLTGNFPKRDHHFSHVDEHPLFFIQKDFISRNKVELGSSYCFVCPESLSGSSFYYCPECGFFLHKSCAFEELPLKIDHALHDKHALILIKGRPQQREQIKCYFCDNDIKGFRYSCSSCEFQLDPRCALLITKDFSKRDHHFSHDEHPLVFVQMLSDEVKINSYCSVCSKPLLGTSFYNCPDCQFFFHKECEAELSTKIKHFAHPQHPLIPRFSPELYTCHFCQGESDRKGIGYQCLSCDFYIHRKCTLPRSVPESKIHDHHDHQLSPFMRKNPFTCDACGGEGVDARFFCLKCNIMIHTDCIFLPKLIKFKLHNHHILGHKYRFPQKEGERSTCQFCFKKVAAEFGSYKCLHSECNYVLHGTCVKKNKGRLYIEVESKNEGSDEASSSSSCAVVLGDKIKHFSHEHELVADNTGIITNGDKECCDGCALPILTAAYSCPQPQCNFSLHKACAEIGEYKPHWDFRESLLVRMMCFFSCQFCLYDCSGFCCWDGIGRRFCLRCSEIPFITIHEAHGHQHSLFCDRDYKGLCSGCGEKMVNGGYKCTLVEEKDCKFALDYRCLTRPLTAQHRFHHHPLKLTYQDPYKDDGDPFQHMCEICEDGRDPKLWFYRCDECDFDAHTDCVLGDFPFIKRRSIYHDDIICSYHQQYRLLYFQSEKYPYPKCVRCGHPCKDQLALKCPHSKCNFALHLNLDCHKSRTQVQIWSPTN